MFYFGPESSASCPLLFSWFALCFVVPLTEANMQDYLAPANASIKQLKLQHGDRIYAETIGELVEASPSTPSKSSHMVGMTLSGKEVVEIMEASPAKSQPVNVKDVKLDEVDEQLSKEDGREKLKASVNRGFGSASIDSMAVEPYDPRLLQEKDIKLMSFQAQLRKLKSVQGGGKFSQLKRHDFGTYGEAGGKGGQEAGWGERAVAMNRIPKPMTLIHQKYRHVDRGLYALSPFYILCFPCTLHLHLSFLIVSASPMSPMCSCPEKSNALLPCHAL